MIKQYISAVVWSLKKSSDEKNALPNYNNARSDRSKTRLIANMKMESRTVNLSPKVCFISSLSNNQRATGKIEAYEYVQSWLCVK